MDQQQIVHAANTFEQLLQHTHFSSLLVGIFIGWGALLIFLIPSRKLVKDDGWALWINLVSCIAGGTLGTFLTWPSTDHKLVWAWSFVAGILSLMLWWLLTHGIAWKFPKAAAALKLNRVSLDSEEDAPDARSPESRADAT